MWLLWTFLPTQVCVLCSVCSNQSGAAVYTPKETRTSNHPGRCLTSGLHNHLCRTDWCGVRSSKHIPKKHVSFSQKNKQKHSYQLFTICSSTHHQQSISVLTPFGRKTELYKDFLPWPCWIRASMKFPVQQISAPAQSFCLTFLYFGYMKHR